MRGSSKARHDELVDIARAEMDALYDQISGSGYALLLTDANGVILNEKADPTLTRMFRGACRARAPGCRRCR
ncbi:MAG: hypothetical protein QM661_00555 [Solimonas sp.]